MRAPSSGLLSTLGLVVGACIPKAQPLDAGVQGQYAATHGQWLRDRTRAALEAGIGVFVTESSGAEASGQGANNYEEWAAWVEFIEKNNISWLNYSVSDKAGETISVLQPGANAFDNWSEAELTESGQHVRRLLRSHCK